MPLFVTIKNILVLLAFVPHKLWRITSSIQAAFYLRLHPCKIHNSKQRNICLGVAFNITFCSLVLGITYRRKMGEHAMPCSKWLAQKASKFRPTLVQIHSRISMCGTGINIACITWKNIDEQLSFARCNKSNIIVVVATFNEGKN